MNTTANTLNRIFSLLALFFLSNATQAAVPLSNLSNTSNTYVADVSFHSTNDVIGALFTTGTSDLTLQKVTLNLGDSQGIDGSSQPLTVDIWSSTIGSGAYNDNAPATIHKPGVLLQNLTAATLRPTVAGLYDYSAGSGLILTANTEYWIYVTSTDSTGDYRWVFDAGSSAFTASSGWSVDLTGAPGTAYGVQDAAFLGGVWDSGDASLGTPIFSITAVPEPSSFALGLAGAGLIWLHRRKKRMVA